MNYRHAYHAGNHADVFKHIVLTRLIALMSRKEQPLAYLEPQDRRVALLPGVPRTRPSPDP